MFRWIGFLILTLALGCASVRTEEVEIPVSRIPHTGFGELRQFGVVRVKNLNPHGNDHLVKRLKRCREFRRIEPVNRFFAPTYDNPQTLEASWKREVPRMPRTNKLHGYLSITVLKNSSKRHRTTEMATFFRDLDQHDFFQSSGSILRTGFGLASPEAFAPKTNKKTGRVGVQQEKYKLKLKYSVYNSVLKKVAQVGEVYGEAEIENYSKAPGIGNIWVYNQLTQGLLDKIVRKVCYKRKKQTRMIYATTGEDRKSRLLDFGVDKALDERWDAAAKKWSTVVKTQNNALAHHNLGVYHEWAGNLDRAMEHYYKARKGKFRTEIEIDRYGEFMKKKFKSFNPRKLESLVYAVEPGGWVQFIRNGKTRFKRGQMYSVYRQRQILDDDMKSIGVALKEVGHIRVVEQKRGFYVARRIDYLNDSGIQYGDLVVGR